MEYISEGLKKHLKKHKGKYIAGLAAIGAGAAGYAATKNNAESKERRLLGLANLAKLRKKKKEEEKEIAAKKQQKKQDAAGKEEAVRAYTKNVDKTDPNWRVAARDHFDNYPAVPFDKIGGIDWSK